MAAASDVFWNNRGEIRCIGATNQGPAPCPSNPEVVVKIVDYCPPGCRGTIDLSRDAFAMIANPDAGKIRISYTQYARYSISFLFVRVASLFFLLELYDLYLIVY